MNTIGRLKSLSLVEAGDDNEWKLDIRIRKDRMYPEDMESAVALQGDTVNVILTEGFDPDYESPRQKKNREEREKYEGIMSEKKRREAESAALPLDGAASEPATGITLPPVEIITIGDYQDPDGNRWTVSPSDPLVLDTTTWVISSNREDTTGLDLDINEYPTEPEAREALKTWCENRGYTAVPPTGYGTVYQSCVEDRVWRIAEDEEAEEGFPIFRAFVCDPSGGNAERLRPLGDDPINERSTVEDAQAELDAWVRRGEDDDPPAAKHVVFGYVLLSSIPVPVEPASPAMAYEDAEGSRYYVCDERHDHAGWFIVKAVGDTETGLDELYPTQEDAQGALDARALTNDWKPVSVTELLQGAAVSEPETIPESDQSHTEDLTLSGEPQVTQDAPLSYSIKEGDWIVRKPSPASRGGLEPQPRKVTSVNKEEGSCFVFGVGTVFFSELDEKWMLAEAPDASAVDAESLEEDGSNVPESEAESE